MLKIRMQRTGKINDPSFRLVVTEHARGPRAGNIVEKVGTYNPKLKQRTIREDRIKHWLSVGAKPSATVHNMLVSLGIINAEKINVLPSYKAPETAAPEGEAAPAADAPAEGAAAPAEATAEAPAQESHAAEGSGEPHAAAAESGGESAGDAPASN